MIQATQETLAALKKDATVSVSGNLVFADGFGKHLDYREDKGAGGMPLLVSAGPDGDFGAEADNIRSDGR